MSRVSRFCIEKSHGRILGDQIVIVSSYDQTDPTLPVERRIALALKRCGVSITCEGNRPTLIRNTSLSFLSVLVLVVFHVAIYCMSAHTVYFRRTWVVWHVCSHL